MSKHAGLKKPSLDDRLKNDTLYNAICDLMGRVPAGRFCGAGNGFYQLTYRGDGVSMKEKKETIDRWMKEARGKYSGSSCSLDFSTIGATKEQREVLTIILFIGK